MALSRAFEPLEARRLLCAEHASTFEWTDPNDPISLARERMRIADLYDVRTPTSFAALSAPAATGSVAGLPILNSNPGAAVDIYLDFDGDVGGGYHQMVNAYDTNGDPNTFDVTEAAVVTQAWQLVSQYFSMFDVNVTTDTPTKPFAWCAIGNNVSGGYSYVGVFPQSTGGRPESYTTSEFARTRATGIAHEVGHNFGLQHQGDYDALGRLSAEYTSGYDAQHGALMGVDYTQRVHKWFYGHPSASALTLQDDMAVIADRIAEIDGGDGYRTDDVGDSIALAGSLATSGVDRVRTGVLERLSDADVYAFASSGGRTLISANPDTDSPVDLKLEILDGSNHVIAAEDLPTSNDAQVALSLPAGTYYARVTSHGNYGDLGQYVLTVSPMPSTGAFDSTDVGVTLRRAGGASYNVASDLFTLRGSGTDIGGSADGFRYAFESLRGDGSITARVTGLSGGNTFAKAGLMIRESLAAGAKHATVEFRGDGNIEMLGRTSTNGATSASLGGAASAGVWLRLTRTGDTLTAERSLDGTTWSLISEMAVAMRNEVLIGLAVTSNKDSIIATASFDRLSVIGDVAPVAYADNGLTAPTGLVVAPTTTGSGLVVRWAPVAGADAYVVERSTDGTTFSTVAMELATATYIDPSLDGSYRYFYRVSAVTDANPTARSAAATASGVNRPSAPAGVTTMSLGTSMISIDWRDTTGETGYRLERSRDQGATWSVIDEIDANQSAYIVSGLSVSNNYQFRVTPLSSLGDGPSSAVVTEGTRLASVSNVHVTASTRTSLTVAWNDLKKVETGYRVERSADNGTSWITVANVGGDVTSYTDAALASFTVYTYRVTATSPYSESMTAAACTGVTQVNPSNPSQALPVGWGSIDVGAVGVPGASGQNGGRFQLYGSGADIGGTSDQFQFAYRRMSGDGEIVAHNVQLGSMFDGAEAGLMFRESLTPDSPFAFVSCFIHNTPPSGSLRKFDYRTSAGGATTTLGGSGGTPDVFNWLKLVRHGDTITGFCSADGVSWGEVGSATVAMNVTIFVGLAYASHDNTGVSGAAFAELWGSAISQVDADPPAAPTLVLADDTGVSGSDGITRNKNVNLSGAAEPGATLTLMQDGTIMTSFVVGYAGTWSFTMPGKLDGPYTFTVTAVDPAGNSSPTVTKLVVVDTAPPHVVSAVFDRELGHRWSVSFDDDVASSLSASDFSIVNIATGASVTPALSYDAMTATASLTLPANARLADGRYELRLAAGAITDLAGNDSVDPLALPFGVLAGDANDSGSVNFADLLILARNYGKSGQTYSTGNFDYDPAGIVDFSDLLILARAYNTNLPAAPVFDASGSVTRSSRKSVAGEWTF